MDISEAGGWFGKEVDGCKMREDGMGREGFI